MADSRLSRRHMRREAQDDLVLVHQLVHVLMRQPGGPDTLQQRCVCHGMLSSGQSATRLVRACRPHTGGRPAPPHTTRTPSWVAWARVQRSSAGCRRACRSRCRAAARATAAAGWAPRRPGGQAPRTGSPAPPVGKAGRAAGCGGRSSVSINNRSQLQWVQPSRWHEREPRVRWQL